MSKPANPKQVSSSVPMAQTHVMGTYARQDIVFVRGEGCWLIADTGERYLDFGSGVAVNSLGHAHPQLVAALKAQAEKLWHTSNLYRVEGQETVAEKLTRLTFAEQVFFCNSGAEACEGAIKVARRYHFVSGSPSASASSRSAAPSMGARWPRSRLPATKSISKASVRPADGLRSRRPRRSGCARGCDRAGNGRDHDRADSGRGRRRAVAADIPQGRARALRQAWPAARARRSSDRHRPDGQAVRARVGRHHARRHGDREGLRRRLSGRRRFSRRRKRPKA